MGWIRLVGSMFFVLGSQAVSRAGIPEPPAIRYGTVRIDGLLVSHTETDVVVRARTAGATQPVGEYQMGQNQPANGQCDGGADCYVLQVKLESSADGAPQSADAARLGDTIQIFVKKGAGPEIPAGTFPAERGSVAVLNLNTGPGWIALPTATASGGTVRVMSRTSGNEARLDYSQTLPSDPPGGSIRIREMLANGAFGSDIPSTGFTFTRAGNRLTIKDKAANLAHRKWYQMETTGTWAGVAPFCFQFLVQAGDCDGNGNVNAADLTCINASIPTAPGSINDGNFRKDINGAQGIGAADLVAANTQIPSAPVAKPSGHTTCP